MILVLSLIEIKSFVYNSLISEFVCPGKCFERNITEDESSRNAIRTNENGHFVGIWTPLTFETWAFLVLSVVGNASRLTATRQCATR